MSECKLCGETFTEMYKLQVHMKKRISIQIQMSECELCGETFTEMYKLQVRMEKKDFPSHSDV